MSFGDAIALTCAFIWATSGLMIRTQSYKVPPSLMNAVRCGVATLFFWVMLPFGEPVSQYAAVTAHEWALLLGSLTLGVMVGDTLYLRSIKEIGVSRTMALVGTYPVTTLFFEQLLLQQPVARSFIAGCCLVAIGVMFLSTRSSKTSGAQESRLLVGVCLSLSAAILWGLSTTLLKPAIANLSPVQANSIRMPLVALVLFGTWLISRRNTGFQQLDRKSLAIVGFTGLLGMGLGSLLFLIALQEI